jgi:hypothetical protein
MRHPRNGLLECLKLIKVFTILRKFDKMTIDIILTEAFPERRRRALKCF